MMRAPAPSRWLALVAGIFAVEGTCAQQSFTDEDGDPSPSLDTTMCPFVASTATP